MTFQIYVPKMMTVGMKEAFSCCLGSRPFPLLFLFTQYVINACTLGMTSQTYVPKMMTVGMKEAFAAVSAHDPFLCSSSSPAPTFLPLVCPPHICTPAHVFKLFFTHCLKILYKVNRCLARYSPRAKTTNQPTNRAPNEPTRPGPK